MLTRHNAHCPRPGLREKQQGVVLVIALIVLVAMTLAGIALVRSVDTSNVIAGNLAFQQAATQSGDRGVEQAIIWLETNNNGATLNISDATNGYIANGTAAGQSPAAGSWDAFWNATLGANKIAMAQDANTGNTVSYVIQRMCDATGPAFSQTVVCSSSSQLSSGSAGNAEEAGDIQLKALSLVFYRITVRVDGPRNTVSYIQSMVAL